MIILEMVLLVIVFLLYIPVIVLLLQVVASLFYSKSTELKLEDRNYTVAVIIPAHNESLGIAHTLQSILPQLKSKDRLIVVADNCNDDTAVVAQDLGATVIVREDENQRGKGYALDYGLQSLNSNPPEVVIIIDADCTISKDGIAHLSQTCVFYKRPVQALYLMTSPNRSSIKSKIAEFAWVVKNQIRPLGFKKLGLPCQLMGTGMAFLWEDINTIKLASGHIAEDMKMGVDLCRANKPPLFLPEVLVNSFFPNAQDAEKNQRTRWEHGHLSVIVSDGPSLLVEAIKTKNLQMLGMTLDLIVPPIAMLSLIIALISILSLFIHLFMPIYAVLFNLGSLLVVFTCAILIAWAFFGRHIISLKQLFLAPLYAIGKVPLYIKFFINRQVEWVRAKRD